MLPDTRTRVQKHTSDGVNQEIKRKTMENICRYVSESKNGDRIERRISELDSEWDIERVLETNAGIFALTGTILGAFVNKKWLILPGIVTTFLIQHALQGWCPPVPVFRRLGYRTASEIEQERNALKSILAE